LTVKIIFVGPTTRIFDGNRNFWKLFSGLQIHPGASWRPPDGTRRALWWNLGQK